MFRHGPYWSIVIHILHHSRGCFDCTSQICLDYGVPNVAVLAESDIRQSRAESPFQIPSFFNSTSAARFLKRTKPHHRTTMNHKATNVEKPSRANKTDWMNLASCMSTFAIKAKGRAILQEFWQCGCLAHLHLSPIMSALTHSSTSRWT